MLVDNSYTDLIVCYAVGLYISEQLDRVHSKGKLPTRKSSVMRWKWMTLENSLWQFHFKVMETVLIAMPCKAVT